MTTQPGADAATTTTFTTSTASTSTASTSTSATTTTTTHVVLVPGFWLGAWAWDRVVPGLRAAGLTPHAVTLPGLASPDDDRSHVTFDDHVDAVVDLLSTLEGDVVLVGHSGGGMVVQHVVDRAPERVRRVVYVDSGPMREGNAINPDAVADVPLPTWEQMAEQGSSTEGLDDALRAELVERAVAHPPAVASHPARPTDPRRLDVPATVICTSIPSDVLQQLVAGGQIPAELPDVRDVTYVDLPTGHWPMLSRPVELADVIAAAARA
ncbi:alpha/beta hydrolase [Actinotalea ferrariae]|uniref:alpha/beta fold hydrolase n=1 Tax=Actinotalea ferrariae TaxID=1386098 RepID=UPI001C8C2D95|nr:alpha/beta fold hydrolase [Actinotalea ferrariae]MBX9243487.1 alpha/beta hydrolase [Actinotalea ferrariae]